MTDSYYRCDVVEGLKLLMISGIILLVSDIGSMFAVHVPFQVVMALAAIVALVIQYIGLKRLAYAGKGYGHAYKLAIAILVFAIVSSIIFVVQGSDRLPDSIGIASTGIRCLILYCITRETNSKITDEKAQKRGRNAVAAYVISLFIYAIICALPGLMSFISQNITLAVIVALVIFAAEGVPVILYIAYLARARKAIPEE